MENKYRQIVPYLTIILAVLFVFGVTLHYDFLATWDDNMYVTGNSLVQNFSWPNIKVVFSGTFLGNYAPLHMLSYMADHALWGLNPIGFRLTNLLLHIFNALFLYLLIKELTQRKDVSLVAALIFSIHPLQVETVAWVSQRKSLLAVAFFLPSLYLYLSYVKTKSLDRYWASVILYGLSLLSKVSTISLPFLLLLYDYSYSRKLGKRNIIDKIPYFLVAGSLSLVAIFTQTTNRPTLFYGDSLLFTLAVSVEVLAEYVKTMLFPLHLSAYYGLFYAPFPSLRSILSILILLLMLGGTVLLFRKNRKAGFWAAWFLVVMLPNLNIIPLQVSMADRYLYIPIIGPVVLFGYLILGSFKNGMTTLCHRRRRVSYGIVVVVIASLGSLSFARTQVWKDDLSLWTDTVRKVPHGVSYSNLGSAYLFSDQKAKAKAAFRKAIELTPNLDTPYQNLGVFALQEKELDKAIFYLKKATTLKPKNWYAQKNLAAAYTEQRNLPTAVETLQDALRYSPGNFQLKTMLAQLLARSGRFAEALPIYEAMVHDDPQDYGSRFDHGVVLLQSGDLDQAEQAFNQAIQINENLPGPYFYLGMINEKKKLYGRAVEHYEEGLSRNEKGVAMMNNLAFLYAEHFPDKVDRAIELAEKAVSLAPKNINLMDTLGWTYFRKGEYHRAIELFQKALDKRPDNPAFLYHAGMANLKAGNKQKAKHYLTRLAEKYPDYRFTMNAQMLLLELKD